MWSQLGTGGTDTVNIPVRNPVTEDLYHLYYSHHHKFTLNGAEINTTTGVVAATPSTHRFEVEIPLHDVEQLYASYSASAPVTNDINMSFYLAKDDATYSHLFSYSVDIEFVDVQDD